MSTTTVPLSSLAPEFNNNLQIVSDRKAAESAKKKTSSKIMNEVNSQDYVPNITLIPVAEVKITEGDCQKSSDVITGSNYGWGWLGALILWFIIFVVLFWLIYYSLHPSFVLQNNSNQIDTAKVLLAAVISALILVIIIWLIKAAVGYSYKKKAAKKCNTC